MKAAGATTILDAINDKQLFAPWFRDHETWAAWFAFIATLFALDMTDEQYAVYQRCTGRNEPPSMPASEAWLVCGRRSGKSFILAMIAVYLACFREYRQFLSPGERATIMIIASDRRQARVIFRYVRAFLTMIPMLKRMVVRETQSGFDLTNGVTIEISSASFKSVRGYTLVAVLADEIAFWPTDDAADPDYAILNAVRPGMATIPNSMLLCASSPYARRGALWAAHRRHFGKDGPILVWQADTRTMNPTISQNLINEAIEADPASAAAEYGAQFRSDVEGFVSREIIEACVDVGTHERSPDRFLSYSAFVDPSGGSADSMTLAIGHREADIAVLDALREVKPPFSPELVVVEFCRLLKQYGLKTVVGDRYGAEWTAEQFRKCGIQYAASDRTKSEIYRDLLPALNSHKLLLLDNSRFITQLAGLERRTARGGKDSIDHSPGTHDDLANAAAGVLTEIVRARTYCGVW